MSKDDGGSEKIEIGFPIQTKDGAEATVSAQDYATLQGFEWRIGANGYVYKVGARLKGVPCLMHRIVMGATKGQEIHHCDGNKLNNMRNNLEVTTPSEHQRHHKDASIARNNNRRIYDETGICKKCGETYKKHPDHRGRQQCCSKQCAILLAVKGNMEAANARRQIRR